MKLPAVEFSPNYVVIDRKYKWWFWGHNQKFELAHSRPGKLGHVKTREQMAKYIRDLLADPTRRAWIHGDTLNIVRRRS